MPVIQINKDKSKNDKVIEELLKDIDIVTPFSVRMEKGVHRIYLENTFIHCALIDSEK